VPSIEQNIISRIETKGKGTCFTPKALLDLGSPEAIRITLHRLEKRGFIRRLARGLYDFPKLHPVMGLLSPHPDEVARALSERDASRVQPSGAYAANVLGLSEQVPARIVFLTDGATRRVKVGNQEIILKNTTPRNMATTGRISGTIIQALRHIGAKQITDRHVAHLRALLSGADKKQVRTDRVYAPGWMHALIDSITEGDSA
jgi:hypothetical protein